MNLGTIIVFLIFGFSVIKTIAGTNVPILSKNTTNTVYHGTYSRSNRGGHPYENLSFFQMATQSTTHANFVFSREALSATNAFLLGTWCLGNKRYWPCSGGEFLVTHELSLWEDGTVSYSAFLWTQGIRDCSLQQTTVGTFSVSSTTQIVMAVNNPFARGITDFSVSAHVFDSQTETNSFNFIPSPATCRLGLVTSNALVWIKYDSDSTVYFQRQLDQKPFRVFILRGYLLPTLTGLLSNDELIFRLHRREYIISSEGCISNFNNEHCLRDIRCACPFKSNQLFTPSLFRQQLQVSKKSGKPITDTLSVTSNKSKNKHDIRVVVVPNERDPFWNDILNNDKFPSVEWLDSLWPIGCFDDSGFVIWNGEKWIACDEKVK